MELGSGCSLIIKNKENLSSKLFVIFEKVDVFKEFMKCAQNECHSFFDRFIPEIPQIFNLEETTKDNFAIFSKSDDFFKDVYRYFDLFPLLRPDIKLFAIITHDNGTHPKVVSFKEERCRRSYISSVNRLHASNIHAKTISAFSPVVLAAIENNVIIDGSADAMTGYKELDRYIAQTNGVLKLLPDFGDKRPYKFKNRDKFQTFLKAYSVKMQDDAKKNVVYAPNRKFHCYLRLTRFDLSLYYSDLPLQHAINLDKFNYNSHLKTLELPTESHSKLPLQPILESVLEELFTNYSVISDEISMMFAKKTTFLQEHTSDWW